MRDVSTGRDVIVEDIINGENYIFCICMDANSQDEELFICNSNYLHSVEENNEL